jgi:hypothetical protein
LSYLRVLTSAEKQRLVGRLTAGAGVQSNAWGSIAGLLRMGSYSVDAPWHKRRPRSHVSCPDYSSANRRRVLYCYGLALIYLPISFALITDLQQAIFRIMPFAALGAFQIAAPRGPLTIIVFGDDECSPATARDQEHFYRRGIGLGHFRVEYTIQHQQVVILSGIHGFACERGNAVEGPLGAHAHSLDWDLRL